MTRSISITISAFFRLCAVLGVMAIALGAVPARAAATPVSPVANVRVSNDAFAAHSEPAIAENPHNHKDLIAGSKMFTNPDRYQFMIGTYYSKDGGKTWHDNGPLPGFGTYDLTSDISIAFSSTGVAYACVLALQGQGSGIFVSKSTDGGKTWSDPVTVFWDNSGATFSDKPWIGVDQSAGATAGNVYVAWNLDAGDYADAKDPGFSLAPNLRAGAGKAVARQASGGSQGALVVSRSTDAGSTWSSPTDLTPFTNTHFAIGALPAVAPDGHVTIVYLAIDGSSTTSNRIEAVTSADAGLTYGPPHVVATVSPIPMHLSPGTFRNLSMPTFAVSPVDGTMAVAWSDMRNGDADILASRSSDGGQTWSAPSRVNDDPLHNGKDQFQPALAAAPNGTFTCSWFDRRYDPNNSLIDEVIAQSANGSKYGPNLRVTKKSWDPAIDAPRPEGKPNNTFIGDYQALAADNSNVHPLWNDTQNGKSQEIRTATMSVRLFTRAASHHS